KVNYLTPKCSTTIADYFNDTTRPEACNVIDNFKVEYQDYDPASCTDPDPRVCDAELNDPRTYITPESNEQIDAAAALLNSLAKTNRNMTSWENILIHGYRCNSSWYGGQCRRGEP